MKILAIKMLEVLIRWLDEGSEWAAKKAREWKSRMILQRLEIHLMAHEGKCFRYIHDDHLHSERYYYFKKIGRRRIIYGEDGEKWEYKIEGIQFGFLSNDIGPEVKYVDEIKTEFTFSFDEEDDEDLDLSNEIDHSEFDAAHRYWQSCLTVQEYAALPKVG